MRPLAIVGVLTLAIALPAAAQSISVQAAAEPGSVVSVVVSGGPANPLDWLTLTLASAADRDYVAWQYLNGSHSQPSAGANSATVYFSAPLTPGLYNIRWFLNNTLAIRIATSATIVVGNGTAPPPAPHVQLLINGDSDTSAYAVGESETWAARVAAARGLSYRNLAYAGKYTGGVLQDVPGMVSQTADVCMVMIGGNDMAAALQNNTPDAEARARYLGTMREIITGLKSGCARIRILSPAFPMVAREVSRYDAWSAGLSELCAELGVLFIDVFGHMKALSAVQSTTQFDTYFRWPGVDAYHLSSAGHAMVAALVLEHLVAQ